MVGCFERVLTLLPCVILSACGSLGAVDPESIFPSDRSIHGIQDIQSLAGKVLLVEDNEVNRTVVRRLLEGMDLDVVEAHDGLLTLSALDRESFDLILMDCQMPNLDGYHTTEEIRMGEEAQLSHPHYCPHGAGDGQRPSSLFGSGDGCLYFQASERRDLVSRTAAVLEAGRAASAS